MCNPFNEDINIYKNSPKVGRQKVMLTAENIRKRCKESHVDRGWEINRRLADASSKEQV